MCPVTPWPGVLLISCIYSTIARAELVWEMSSLFLYFLANNCLLVLSASHICYITMYILEKFSVHHTVYIFIVLMVLHFAGMCAGVTVSHIHFTLYYIYIIYTHKYTA